VVVLIVHIDFLDNCYYCNIYLFTASHSSYGVHEIFVAMDTMRCTVSISAGTDHPGLWLSDVTSGNRLNAVFECTISVTKAVTDKLEKPATSQLKLTMARFG
jgi:hypothetical protein